ncbi:MAG: TonB-dependent receptor plug domain-containing protein [Nitrospirales bacterium]
MAFPSSLRRIIILTLLFSHQSLTEAAEERPVTQLDTIVVSASALHTPLASTPANVTVITQTEIEAQQAQRLSEILQQIAGLHVDEMGGRGGINSLYIRGGDPNFTLIMIDGVPINDPTNQRGGSVDLSTLTPERIKQIEIIRGPLSARYGSEAVSGVINIITQAGEKEAHQSLQLAGGRFGYTREVLQAHGPIGPATYALSFAHTRNDAQVKHDRFALKSIGWHVDWRNDLPINVRMTGQFTHSSSRAFPEGSGGPRLAFLQETEKRKSYELVTGLHADYDLTDYWQQTFSMNLFRRTFDNKNPGVFSTPSMFRIPPNRSDSTYTRIQPRWEQTIVLAPNWSIAGGIQLTTEIGKRNGIQKLTALGAPTDQNIDFHNTRSTGAFFTELSATIFSDIHLTGGIRVDMPEGFGTEMSPRIALSYQVTELTRIRAGYGEGYKLPGMASLGDPIIGNSQLKPESSRGWDIGIKQSFAQNVLEAEITYFHNRFSQLIDLDPSLAQMNIFRLVNLQTVTTQGLELSAQITPFTGYTAKGFMTYLDTNIHGSLDRLRNRPKWSGGIIFRAQPSSGWTIRTQVRAIGTRVDLQIPTQENEVNGYVKTDLAITYHPTPTWRFFGAIENLSNARYEEFLGFPAPRLIFRLGLKYTR